ncbi:peptidase S10 [Alteromonas sediminis]|uniref:Peptidase S10 n=2 Tax=Alteromonas sediminis TaxID=2259342 RepID=A0A3N5YC78_9ALTE|nr:peptidase S10 [Alteromonas sediminis]
MATPFTMANDSVEADAPSTETTEHKARIQGKNIRYQVAAGDTQLKDEEGNPSANIFSFYYQRTDVEDRAQRPLIFVFNGGPGSSSVWLHMGVFGPKKVVIPSDAERVGAPPYPILDNPESLLDIADLVFIDPVGTGYSKPVGGKEGKAFWGIKEDAETLAQFIRVFVTRHQRWNSPKYLAGESYGTTRAAAIVGELQEGWGSMDLSGVFLISSILDFQTGDFTPGNDLPFITFLPTYAATAWYHNALPDRSKWDDLPAFLDDVRQFALNDYATTLLKGALATDEEYQNAVDKLHQFTGLRQQYIQQTDLRINEHFFMKELLRDRGEVVGRLDSRYVGEDESQVRERPETDPSSYAIDGAYTAAIQSYMAKDLNVIRDNRYQVLSGEVFRNWNWLYGASPRAQGFVSMSPILSKAMRQNKDFRIFIANGYYDLATPFFATEYSMNHFGYDQERIKMAYYEAGHMMYIHHPSLESLAQDMRAFLLQQ